MTRRGPRGSRRVTRRGWLVVVAVALALLAPAAWAYFSPGSAAGGAGAVAAAALPQGGTPTATGTGSAVTLSWPAATVSTGAPVDGYRIARYDAADRAVQTVHNDCSGVVTARSCTDTGVPSGSWTYTVTPVLGDHWVGVESPDSDPVTTDARVPSNALSLSSVNGDAVLTGTTVYYRGAAPGSFRLTNAVTAPGLGPVSSRTAALGGDPTGWTHSPSTVTLPVGGPFVSNPFSWTAGTTSSPTEAVTGRSVVGNQAVTTLTFADDSAAPTAGSVSYVDGSAHAPTTAVTFTTGTDSGSGVGTRLLQRASAPRSGLSCGTYTDFATVAGGTDPTSPYLDSLDPATCYQYRYVVSDALGNQTVATSSAVAYTGAGADWGFEEGSGTTAEDATANGNTATLQPGAGWAAGTVGDGALALSGASDSWASTPRPVVDTSQSFTVATWVRLDSLDGPQTLAGMEGTNVSSFFLQDADDGRWRFALFGSDATSGSSWQADGQGFATAGVWTQVTGVYDASAGTAKLYVDGALQSVASGVSPFRATGATLIGRGLYGGPGDYTHGALDDTRFFDRALTAAQVGELVNGTAGPTGGSVDAVGLTGTGSRYTTSTALSLALDPGSDPNGLATSGTRLSRASGTLSGGACGTYGGYATVATDPDTSVSDTVSDGACYRYRYRVPDQFGNVSTYTSPDIKVDTTGPSGAAVSYPDGDAGGTTVAVTLTTGADAQSGIGTRLLQRASAVRTGMTCGSVGSFATIATNPTTPFSDSITAGSCYQYRYVVANNAGAVDVATSSSVVRSDDGAEWDFEEGAGSTAADSTGNRNTATLQSGAGWGAGTVHAKALALTGGSNSWAAAAGPVVDTSRSFTAAAWVKLNDLGGYRTVVSMDGSSVSPFYLQKNGDGRFAFGLFGTDSTSGYVGGSSGVYPTTGTWYHIAGVYDATAHTATLYVDGVAQPVATGVSTFEATGPTAVGRSTYAGNTDFVNGSIDDVRLYDRALTPTQVTVLAGTGDAGPTGGSVDVSGLAGTGSRYATSTTVPVVLAQGSDPDGLASSGDLLSRATASLAGGTCGAYGGYGQLAADPPSPYSDTVADGACYRYRYRVLDGQGNSSTYTSPDVKVDTTGPSAPTLVFSGLTDAFVSGGTVYYQPGSSSGSFTVTATSEDPASGLATYTFPSLGAGWTATPGGPGVMTYAWSAPNPEPPGGPSVVATSNAGATAGTGLAVTADGTAPSAGSISYADGVTSASTVSVSFAAGTDAGSGIATRLLQRASAPLTAGGCGTYTSYATVTGGSDPTSPFSDRIASGSCYRYRYVVSDNLGNSDVASSTAVVSAEPSTYAAAVLATSGLHSFYELGEPPGATRVVDEVGANTGDYLGGVSLGLPGALSGGTDTAAGFDGADDYARVTRQISGDFSLEFWFSSTQGIGTGDQWWQGAGLVDGEVVGSTNDFGVTLRSDGRVVAGVGNPDTSVVSSVAGLNDGSWHHLVFTRTRSTGGIVLYVDGVDAGSATGNTNSLTSPSDLDFGRLASGANYYAGRLDDVAIYDSVLSPATVQAHVDAR